MFNAYILGIGLILWLLQYGLAYDAGWLTPNGMREQFPGQSVLPLLWHGGIWFDLPLTFWLAYIAKKHPEWGEWQWIIAF